MPANGYSLIELLVVMVIMSVIGIVGYVNYKQFASAQITTNAISQIQSVLRLAQSNAASSTVCLDNINNSPWSVSFKNQTSIGLDCGLSNTEERNYTLENARIDSIVGSADPSSCSAVFPFNISYSNSGSLIFSSTVLSSTCLQSSSWTFTVRNLNDNTFKMFKISKGGAVDVQ